MPDARDFSGGMPQQRGVQLLWAKPYRPSIFSVYEKGAASNGNRNVHLCHDICPTHHLSQHLSRLSQGRDLGQDHEGKWGCIAWVLVSRAPAHLSGFWALCNDQWNRKMGFALNNSFQSESFPPRAVLAFCQGKEKKNQPRVNSV
jgi:hypothetical protein